MNQVGIDISNEVFDATMQHGSGIEVAPFVWTAKPSSCPLPPVLLLISHIGYPS